MNTSLETSINSTLRDISKAVNYIDLNKLFICADIELKSLVSIPRQGKVVFCLPFSYNERTNSIYAYSKTIVAFLVDTNSKALV